MDGSTDSIRPFWVLGEMAGNDVHHVTLELLGKAERLTAESGAEVWALLPGGNEEAARRCVEFGADRVLILDGEVGFMEERTAATVTALIAEHGPAVLLTGATVRGRALAPRIAVLNHAGLTADCTGLDIEADTGLLLQTRPAFGGNLIAVIKSAAARPQMATVRPHVFPLPDSDPAAQGTIEHVPTQAGEIGGKEITETSGLFPETNPFTGAHFIVAGGRGVRGPEGFAMLKELADTVGGAVGATRAAVDMGWIPYEHQIGQTGKTVRTRVYLACGISGQIQHLAGMQDNDLIIAINLDPEAPIMKIADIAISGDVFTIVPALTSELRRHLPFL